jgi:hypothetical protein
MITGLVINTSKRTVKLLRTGSAGADGWSPTFAIVADGSRRVVQVPDWTGGTGTKPTTGLYIGSLGLVSNIASAVDLAAGGGGGGGSGSVTSVNASGGTTGLAFTGGPVTTSGTLTLSGTLAVANGGTGSTTAGGARTALGLGTSAVLDVASSGDATSGQVVKGSDSRLTDARTPTTHTHTASQISDSGTTGRAIVQAANAAAALTTLGINSAITLDAIYLRNPVTGSLCKVEWTGATDDDASIVYTPQ